VAHGLYQNKENIAFSDIFYIFNHSWFYSHRHMKESDFHPLILQFQNPGTFKFSPGCCLYFKDKLAPLSDLVRRRRITFSDECLSEPDVVYLGICSAENITPPFSYSALKVYACWRRDGQGPLKCWYAPAGLAWPSNLEEINPHFKTTC
jgi:hypothetical protein